MWLQWWLCLLYMLQVVVLLGMIAGYIYDVSNASPPQTPSQVALFQLASDGPEKEKISRLKSYVKMKAIPLWYLKDNVHKVSSRLELVRLFMDSEVDDRQLNPLMSRSIRSVPHSSGRGVKLHQTFLQNKDTLTHESGSTFDVGKDSKRKDKSFQEHVLSAEKNVFSPLDESVDADGLMDTDYYTDYPQDEYTEDEPTHDSLEAFEAALHHIEEANVCSALKCREPTPFVHTVRDPHDETRIFLPECVVLHRCMNYTGCCGDGNECVPKSVNVLTKSFLVIDRSTEREGHVEFNPNMATTLTFVNHTECECRQKPKLPKCTQVCPRPFRLTQEGPNCKCDCLPLPGQDGWPCQRVRDGLVPLSHDELVCIKNGNCYTPECAVEDFHINTGFCPLTDEYAIPAFLFQNPDERRMYREHLSGYDFTKPLTKYTHSDRGDETGSFPTPYSGVHDYQKTTGGKRLKRALVLTDTIEQEKTFIRGIRNKNRPRKQR